MNDEQEQLIHDTMMGRRCLACGEPIEPDAPCEACADKRQLLRQAFPRLYGDA